MQNNFTLTENGINSLLNISQINTEINLDIYLQLIQYKLLSEKHNLFQCTLKDDTNIYDKFILKSKKELNTNNIIHIIKIKITITGEKKYFNCLIYENLEINVYINRLNKQKYEQEKKEKEQKEQKEQEELKKKKIEEEVLRKKKKEEDELKKKKIEEELKRKKIEEEELKKKKMEEEEELKRKKIEEEELKKKKMEEEEELNKVTKLILYNRRYTAEKPRYNFKWEKGNLKYTNFKQKLNDINNIIENEENNYILELDKPDEKDKEKVKEKDKGEENKKVEEINEIEDKEEEKQDKVENEDKKEIEDIFKGINIEELFKINKKRQSQSKKLEQEFDLIVNLSTRNYRKPIYVKCINKALLTAHNTKKYLYYIFRDTEGCEINAYTHGEYNIKIVDEKISSDGVYIISRYKVKSMEYTNHINGNIFLILTAYTKIDPMPPDPIFNNIHFHFLTIDDLFYFKENCIADICGIIYDEGEARYFNMKDGQKYMRNVLIADTSMKKITVTLYEPHSNDKKIKLQKGSILAIKYAKIGLTSTKIKKINTTNYTIIRNTTGDYQHDLLLKEFYEKNQNLDNFLFIYAKEDYKYLKDIKSQIEYNSMHNVENFKLTFITKAYVENFYLDENSIYKSCPLCSKKLIQTPDNKYQCFLCNKIFNQPKYTFLLTLRVRDTNDKAFFKLIGTRANKILEVEPELVRQYLDNGNAQELENIEKKILFNEYIFTVTLTSFKYDKTGKIMHNMNIDNMEKADGENLKRILKLMQENEDNN